MWDYIKGHVKPFWTGFTGSGVLWGGILFADIRPEPIEYILRLLGAGAIAFVSGLCTVFATDFYKEVKATFKKKKDEKLKKEVKRNLDKERAA